MSCGVAFEAYLSWQRVLANAAPGLTVFMLLAALTRRLLMPILLVSALHALVYLVSSIKYRLLDIVLVLQDVHFISGLDASSIALLWHYVPSPWRAAGLRPAPPPRPSAPPRTRWMPSWPNSSAATVAGWLRWRRAGFRRRRRAEGVRAAAGLRGRRPCRQRGASSLVQTDTPV